MNKTKQFASAFAKVIFALTLLLMFASLICSAITSVYAQEVCDEHEHHHEVSIEHSEDEHYVGEYQEMVTEDFIKGEPGFPSRRATCLCPAKYCKQCYEEKKNDKGQTYYTPNCKIKTADGEVCPYNILQLKWFKNLKKVLDVVDNFLTPILIIVGTGGSIYVIVLGVQFSKAENAEKREEAKKRMIFAIIGLVVTMVLLIMIKIFTANVEDIMLFINSFN